MLAALFHYKLHAPDMMRFLGDTYTGEHRNITSIVQTLTSSSHIVQRTQSGSQHAIPYIAKACWIHTYNHVCDGQATLILVISATHCTQRPHTPRPSTSQLATYQPSPTNTSPYGFCQARWSLSIPPWVLPLCNITQMRNSKMDCTQERHNQFGKY